MKLSISKKSSSIINLKILKRGDTCIEIVNKDLRKGPRKA
jgi:hypothetical protein